jgi:hypothetical protein
MFKKMPVFFTRPSFLTDRIASILLDRVERSGVEPKEVSHFLQANAAPLDPIFAGVKFRVRPPL